MYYLYPKPTTTSIKSSQSTNRSLTATTLCHACQLQKQVKLTFYHFDSIVKSPFDNIHSHIWTSPIASTSCIKYYALFLDHFSHFHSVYLLHQKSDAFSKSSHFCAYVHTQFRCEIIVFHCEHDSEFDNISMHNLFATNDIHFWFSCPLIPQQNGKSEQIIRTINNVVRTLHFRAYIPPEYWVEALHMAVHLLT